MPFLLEYFESHEFLPSSFSASSITASAFSSTDSAAYPIAYVWSFWKILCTFSATRSLLCPDGSVQHLVTYIHQASRLEALDPRAVSGVDDRYPYLSLRQMAFSERNERPLRLISLNSMEPVSFSMQVVNVGMNCEANQDHLAPHICSRFVIDRISK